MGFFDLIHLSYQTISSQKQRALLTVLGLVIGIAAVVILTAIGRGIHQFVLAEFTQFGTNLVAIFPGKTTTFGLSGATISTVRPLTTRDAASLKNVEHIVAVVPLVQGNARIEAGEKQRRASVFGVGPCVPDVWKIKVQLGRFLPQGETARPRAHAVLGSRLRDELFGSQNPLGQRVRIGADRYRVIGVMEKKGQMVGFDMDDSIYIPADKALEMFNRESLMEIDVLYQSGIPADSVKKALTRKLIARHGQEDFTVITQNQMLETMDSILAVLTMAVAALGGISLLVGSVGILTIMTIAVSERIAEIGLLRAVGAEQKAIFQIFLVEAIVLSMAGGCAGIAVGISVAVLIGLVLPQMPVELAWHYIAGAFVVTLLIGVASGVFPALKAARLNPLDALRAE